MSQIFYIDRQSGEKKQEAVYGSFFIDLLYNGNPLARVARNFLSKNALFSRLYGAYMKSPSTKKAVLPFINKYEIDTEEFLKRPGEFSSFNDFFVRELKKEARPIQNKEVILPADARYLAFQNLQEAPGIFLKGKKFSLETLLQDKSLAEKYASGACLIARLCPTDYHRFHFPCSGTANEATLINGPLFSVNPTALKQNIEIFSENKRMITSFKSDHFGDMLLLEIGATNVGSIIQTFTPEIHAPIGTEKGYFSFGGSALMVLFEPGKITLDTDLIENTKQGLETRGLLGQSLGAIAK